MLFRSLFGQIFSMMLESRERSENAAYEAKARAIADRMMSAVASDNQLLTDAQWLGDMIFDTIPADGVGVYLDGQISLSGMTPDVAAFGAVVERLNGAASSQIYTTDCIAGLLPSAADWAEKAAGLMAIPISRTPRDYVVLFRPEILQSVRWAGNPEKAIEHGPNGDRLTPRKSFEEWRELVKGKSAPFTAVELRVAEALRVAMLEVVLRLSDAASADRQKAHEKQELLVAELNHRVRNILSLIRGLISQTRASAVSAEGFIDTLDDRIQALARAHDQITADRWGPGKLYDLIEIEAGAYLGTRRDRVELSGPNILLTPQAFTVLALVIHELLTNAAKYGALSDNGTVSIDWTVDDDGSLLMEWREIGGPAVAPPSRRGFGTTIIDRSIPYDLDGRAEVHYRLTGLEASFCIPSRHVVEILENAPEPVSSSNVQSPANQGLLNGEQILLVEDNMIIGMDAEDALIALGASAVHTAPSIVRALSILDTHQVDMAVLDFNLGSENSMPVARVLAERSIPFMFATGYGDGLELGDPFAHIPVINKPYAKTALSRAIGALSAS